MHDSAFILLQSLDPKWQNVMALLFSLMGNDEQVIILHLCIFKVLKQHFTKLKFRLFMALQLAQGMCSACAVFIVVNNSRQKK